MPEPSAFDYAVIRVVPHVEREEFVNVGVILFCSTRRFLEVRIRLDEARLKSLSPELDMVQVRDHLDLIARVAAGGAPAGPLGQLSRFERFQWLVSPRSTTIQVSPVHGGLADDLSAAIEDLFTRLVS